MYILGDIGNSETKVFLVNSKYKTLKRLSFSTRKLNNKVLNKKFNLLGKNIKKVKKILFCSVVPNSFYLIKIWHQITFINISVSKLAASSSKT